MPVVCLIYCKNDMDALCVSMMCVDCIRSHVNCIFQVVREAPREAVNVDGAAQLFSQL